MAGLNINMGLGADELPLLRFQIGNWSSQEEDEQREATELLGGGRGVLMPSHPRASIPDARALGYIYRRPTKRALHTLSICV
jgi:hypothetical protein